RVPGPVQNPVPLMSQLAHLAILAHLVTGRRPTTTVTLGDEGRPFIVLHAREAVFGKADTRRLLDAALLAPDPPAAGRAVLKKKGADKRTLLYGLAEAQSPEAGYVTGVVVYSDHVVPRDVLQGMSAEAFAEAFDAAG